MSNLQSLEQTRHVAVVSKARHLADVVERAAEVGLPLPFTARIFAQTSAVELQVDSIAELADWSHWLEAPIKSEAGRGTNSAFVFHTVMGFVGDAKVTVTAVAPVAVKA